MRLKQACLLIIVGGAVALGGTFLHWFQKFKFWRIWPYTDFKILTGICAGLAALLALTALLNAAAAGQRPRLGRVAGAAAMMAAGAIAAVDLSVGQFLHHDAAANGVHYSAGIGFWLMLAGAGVLLVGGLLAMFSDPVGAAVPAAAAGGHAAAVPVQPQPVRPQPVQPQPVPPLGAQDVRLKPQPEMAGVRPGREETARAGTGAADPGWYEDPSGRFKERYWDGRTWTEHTR